MQTLIKYIIKREYKLIMSMIGVYVLVEALFWIGLLNKTLFGQEIYSQLTGLAIFIPILIVVERTGWYVEKGMLFDNKEHYMLIPVSSFEYITSVYIVNALEIGLITSIIGAYRIGDLVVVAKLVLLAIVIFMAIQSLGMWVLALVAKKTKNRLNANVVLAFVMLALVIIVSTAIGILGVIGLSMPFWYNGYVGVFSIAILLFAIGFYGLCHSVGYGIDSMKTPLKVFVTMIVIAVLIYGVGQGISYAQPEWFTGAVL